MLKMLNIELARRRIAELQQVQRGQIASRVIEEHIFRAGIRRADFAGCRAGVPIIDGGMILDARISRCPSGIADLIPKLARLHGARHTLLHAPVEVPVAVIFNSAQEVIRHAHGVVGVLAGNRSVGFAIPIGVIGVELNVGVALLGELDNALDVIIRHLRLARFLDGTLQRGVLFNLKAIIALAFAIHASLHNGRHVLLDGLGTGHERGNLLLLVHLPLHIFFDIRMVHIDHHHLGRAARGAARLDGTGGAIADL